MLYFLIAFLSLALYTMPALALPLASASATPTTTSNGTPRGPGFPIAIIMGCILVTMLVSVTVCTLLARHYKASSTKSDPETTSDSLPVQALPPVVFPAPLATLPPATFRPVDLEFFLPRLAPAPATLAIRPPRTSSLPLSTVAILDRHIPRPPPSLRDSEFPTPQRSIPAASVETTPLPPAEPLEQPPTATNSVLCVTEHLAPEARELSAARNNTPTRDMSLAFPKIVTRVPPVRIGCAEHPFVLPIVFADDDDSSDSCYSQDSATDDEDEDWITTPSFSSSSTAPTTPEPSKDTWADNTIACGDQNTIGLAITTDDVKRIASSRYEFGQQLTAISEEAEETVESSESLHDHNREELSILELGAILSHYYHD